MRVNFVYEFNALMRFCRNNALPLRERMLLISLFYIANDRAIYDEESQTYEWPEDFIPVANGEMELYSTLDKRAIDGLRNSLKQRGVIDFRPGMKNSRPPMYKLNYLSVDVGCKNVPNDVPNHVPKECPRVYPTSDQGCTQEVTKDVPNTTPYTKNKRKENISEPNQGGARMNVDGGGLVDMGDTELPWGGLI